MKKESSTGNARPLSPHIQIYRRQLTSVMSITHRITGVALSLGMLLLTVMIFLLAYAPAYFDSVIDIIRNPLGQVVMIGLSFALFYHLCSGIRHLVWDMGYGFSIPTVYKSGYAAIMVSVVMTMVFWYVLKFMA